MFMLVFLYDTVPYQESTTLQTLPHSSSSGRQHYLLPGINVTSQMTDSRQHVESTTLQPCCTAATVGATIYVRLACPRYAAASCLCQSLS